MPRIRMTTPANHPAATAAGAQFVRLDVAAQRWDVSTDTIRRLISSGDLPAYRLNGRILRVELSALDACFRPVPSAASGAGL